MEKTQTTSTIYNRAKAWQLILFTMNDVAFNVYFFAIGFMSYFSTGIVGLTVVVTSYMLTAMRIFDGITDPIIGVILDKTDTKFGKFRPFMVIGNAVLAISLIIMYYVTPAIENFVLRVIFFIVLYMIFLIGYTLQGAATRAGQSTLTSDPKQRPMVSIVSGTGCTLVFVVLQIIASSILVPKHGGFNDAFFKELLIYIVVMSGVLTALAVVGIWGKDKPEFYSTFAKKSDASTKVRLREYWAIIKGNKALQMLVLAASTDKLASTISGNSIVGVMVFGIICGNYALSGEIGAYTMIPTLILLFFGAIYAGRMGQRKAVILFSSLAILFQTLIFALFVFTDPTQLGVNAVTTTAFIVIYVLMRGSMGIPGSLVIPMIADCSDYETYRSGKFVPGLMGTLFSFIDKTISAFGNTIVGLLIASIGYTAAQPTVDDVLTTPIFAMAMFMWCGLPIIGWICSLIAMRLSPLTKEKMLEIQEHITKLKAENIANK